MCPTLIISVNWWLESVEKAGLYSLIAHIRSVLETDFRSLCVSTAEWRPSHSTLYSLFLGLVLLCRTLNKVGVGLEQIRELSGTRVWFFPAVVAARQSCWGKTASVGLGDLTGPQRHRDPLRCLLTAPPASSTESSPSPGERAAPTCPTLHQRMAPSTPPSSQTSPQRAEPANVLFPLFIFFNNLLTNKPLLQTSTTRTQVVYGVKSKLLKSFSSCSDCRVRGHGWVNGLLYESPKVCQVKISHMQRSQSPIPSLTSHPRGGSHVGSHWHCSHWVRSRPQQMSASS